MSDTPQPNSQMTLREWMRRFCEANPIWADSTVEEFTIGQEPVEKRDPSDSPGAWKEFEPGPVGEIHLKIGLEESP